VYLIDTNVISELRKKSRANRGVISFFQQLKDSKQEIYLSVISIGELRRGVELIRHRGDIEQAKLLENWLERLLSDYSEKILELDTVSAQLWGRLRAPNPENSIDKQIAAIALVHDLIVVTRNITDFDSTGVATFNPFVT
jgi:predicted nucleic acid-binding protein